MYQSILRRKGGKYEKKEHDIKIKRRDFSKKFLFMFLIHMMLALGLAFSIAFLHKNLNFSYNARKSLSLII